MSKLDQELTMEQIVKQTVEEVLKSKLLPEQAKVETPKKSASSVIKKAMEVVKKPSSKTDKTTAPVGRACAINFGRVKNKSVKVFVGKEQQTEIEIIGSRGKYSVYTDPENKELSKIRGTSGDLKTIKSKVSDFLCGQSSTGKGS